jgi:acyl-CoA synthetase (AMP-forming)/AMP-acid ligase II
MLVVRGPNVTAGYLNDPEQTAAAFTRDGYLKSSDMAYVREGYAYIVGRYDDIFNCGGEKISPAEIERALCEHAHVRAAAVAGISDPQRGKVPVAFLQTTCDVHRADLTAHLGQLVSRSKIPQRFFRVSEFPLTSNGKLQRRHLSVDAPYVLDQIL